ncbi:MAG: hypothetical protein R6U11_09665 [Bacteroidales bacterium]
MKADTELQRALLEFKKEDMISFLNSHPECFDEAINLAITENQPFSWRSAWLLWSCIEENDARVRQHIMSIIKSIKNKKDGHQRELIKILSKMELNEEEEGFVFDICVTLWEKTRSAPSVRYHALLMILKIADKHPELKNEIAFLLQNHYLESLSPGVKNAVGRIAQEVFDV